MAETARPAVTETAGAVSPSYHDLFITTAEIPRTSIFDLGYGLQVWCTRTTGWKLWDVSAGVSAARSLGGEYEGPDNWLVLDVDGHVIVDSRQREDELPPAVEQP